MKKLFTTICIAALAAGLIFIPEGCFRLHKPKDQTFSHRNGIAYFKQRSINNTYAEIDSAPFEIIGKPKLAEIIDVAIDVRILSPNSVNVHVSLRSGTAYLYYNRIYKTGELIENDYFSFKVKLKNNLSDADLMGVYFFRFLAPDKPLPRIPIRTPAKAFKSVPFKTTYFFKEGDVKSKYDTLDETKALFSVFSASPRTTEILNIPIYFEIINSKTIFFNWNVNNQNFQDTINDSEWTPFSKNHLGGVENEYFEFHLHPRLANKNGAKYYLVFSN